jgi:hypothetical protein
MKAASGSLMSDDLEPCDLPHDTVRVLMAGVRTCVDRMKGRLPAHVDVNDVVSAGYLALTQALAYWQDDSEDPLEVHAMKRATAAMVAALRTTNPPSRNGRRFAEEMARVQQSPFDALGPEPDAHEIARALRTGATNHPELPQVDERTSVGALDTIVSPPCRCEQPERRLDVEPTHTIVDVRGGHDIAMEEIGVRVA